MSKGLEALEELLKNHPFHEEDCDRVVIIEKELKRLEEIDNGAFVPIHINRYNELSDKKEALEIIKSKIKIKLDYTISHTAHREEKRYFIETQEDIIPITQEEYDLLKEVLL